MSQVQEKKNPFSRVHLPGQRHDFSLYGRPIAKTTVEGDKFCLSFLHLV